MSRLGSIRRLFTARHVLEGAAIGLAPYSFYRGYKHVKHHRQQERLLHRLQKRMKGYKQTRGKYSRRRH